MGLLCMLGNRIWDYLTTWFKLFFQKKGDWSVEKCDFCPPHQKNVPKTYSIRKHTHAIFSRLTGYAVRLFECQL